MPSQFLRSLLHRRPETGVELIVFDHVRADIARLTDDEPTALGKIAIVVSNPGLHAVLLYRLARWLHVHHLAPVAVFASYVSSVVTGAQISSRADIGEGLALYHPHGTVIGAGAVIGAHCTLVHGNVIGQHYGGGDRPTLGDHVIAGTGAKILGKIHVGNRVRIGANAVVITSIPDGSTVSIPRATVLQRAGPMPAGAGERPAREAIRRRLTALVTATVDGMSTADDLDESTHLLGAGVGMDSIEVLKLLCAIEEEFQVTIDEGELSPSDFASVGSVVSFIERRLPASAETTNAVIHH